MTSRRSWLACAGCGWAPPDEDPYPFRCANAGSGDDVDHVIGVRKSPRHIPEWPDGDEQNPFVRYRELLHSHDLALERGLTDPGYVELVERLDGEIAAVDGRGFVETPFVRTQDLSRRLGLEAPGGVWVKDETGNVSGSHKSRHLFGVLLHLMVVEEAGLVTEQGERPDLAVASCGNAALAAAIVARAAHRRLRVFVPTWADPIVLERLGSLGSLIQVCDRRPGVSGDPTYHELQRAMANGALPFTCQGNLNGLAIEGGQTLGYEMVSELRASGDAVDGVFVQVGGGALASAVARAFEEASLMGAVDRLPRIHAVQALGGHPLKRAYDQVAERLMAVIEAETGETLRSGDDEGSRAEHMRGHAGSAAVLDALDDMARHRSQFMWPWEDQPKSVAEGILDDETYDWLAVVRGMILTGGYPVVVGEGTLERANELGRVTARVDVDHTGTAGLAGLIDLLDRGEVGTNERFAVLFTGARRHRGESR